MATDPGKSFLAEIGEQPRALRDLAEYYRRDGRDRLLEWARMARKSEAALFCGMGTSEFVPRLILDLLENRGIAARTVDAGEWLHFRFPFRGCIVLTSQSGESLETREVSAALCARDLTVAVVNQEESSIARSAALVLPMRAGSESAISTKTYTNSLGLLFLMLHALDGESAMARACDSVEEAADRMGWIHSDSIEQAAGLLSDAASVHFVSRGYGMTSALQSALTFMEGTRVHASASTGGAFRHGPMEVVDESHRSVFFIPRGRAGDLLAGMARELSEKESRVVAVTETDLVLPGRTCAVFRVPRAQERLFPLIAAPAHELLLEAVARRRGVVPGAYRYGSKVTVRE